MKTLGLALIAVLAMSATAASAAQAQFTASSATWATGTSTSGNEIFSTEGGDVECAAHFSGKVATSTNTITVTASYFECEAFGFAEATVINGCDYSFYSTGHIDLACPAANKLVVIAGSCEIQIGSQAGLNLIHFANGATDLTARADVNGLKYTVTKDGTGCPFGGTGQKTGGRYTQSSAVTFQSTGGATISVDDKTPSLPAGPFTANSYPTATTASSAIGNDVITVEGSTQECSTHFDGVLVKALGALRIAPEYTNCQQFGKASGTYSMNGCAYVLSGSNEFAVDCPSGKVMVIIFGNCEVQIGTQSGLKSVTLANNGSHVNVQFNVSGITANVTKDGFLCPLSGTGHKMATYKQASAVTFVPVSGGTSISVD